MSISSEFVSVSNIEKISDCLENLCGIIISSDDLQHDMYEYINDLYSMIPNKLQLLNQEFTFHMIYKYNNEHKHIDVTQHHVTPEEIMHCY